MNAPSTMQALVKIGTGPESVQLQPFVRPPARAGYAVLQVRAAGVCGTDLHLAQDEYACEPPVIMGHEILGQVADVHAEDDQVWLGADVVTETYFSTCERCDRCRAGQRNLCPERRSLGSFEDGGFAPYVLVPIIGLHRLPESLTGMDAVLAEPLACVTHCLLDPPVIGSGDSVLVTGPGAMGQLAAQVAHAQGADVCLLGLPQDAERLAVAAELGLRTSTTPPTTAYDVVIECSGSAAGARTALAAARRGGHYVQVGIFGSDVSLPADLILYKELTVTSGFASTATSWRRAMSLIEQGRVTLGPLITQQVPLADWARAFSSAANGEGIKTVIVP